MHITNITNSRYSATAMLAFMMALSPLSIDAQEPEPAYTLTIGGRVYGGGKNGAIGTDNANGAIYTYYTAEEAAAYNSEHSEEIDNGTLSAVAEGDVKSTVSAESVNIKLYPVDDPEHRLTDPASTVKIYDGTVGTVFGGGSMGRAFGNTSVLVSKTATITDVYGAGDGSAAQVFGKSDVTIENGTILHNVYGGGNAADLIGSSNVHLLGGDMQGNVFGGACKADIYGYTYVNIDGANLKNDMLVNAVYGGNDISGRAQSSEVWEWTQLEKLPVPFTVNTTGIDASYNAFIRSTKEVAGKHIFIGQLFGGGNGDYDYTTGEYAGLEAPTIDKTYLEISGGTYGYVYGGGNKANVLNATDICINNTSDITTSIKGINLANKEGQTLNLETIKNAENKRLIAMGINLSTFTNDYQFIRVFGGNNKTPMAIQPTWHLLNGSINNLYSGGNEGAMTNRKGILLDIDEGSNITVHNVYGGCRKADVNPTAVGEEQIDLSAPEGYPYFADGMAARVQISGGNITNVYGGSDITGRVYGGNGVNILTTIHGDVYGGGNGSYAYTDNPDLKDDIIYGDFYYGTYTDAQESATALYRHRPNAEEVSIYIAGKENKTTIVEGSIYVGGNSATLYSSRKTAKGELVIGSYAVADQAFLGNNGENMVKPELLAQYAGNVVGVDEQSHKFSHMTLRDATVFSTYMDGAAMSILPSVREHDEYDPYTSGFGSFYCGGNVGSITYPDLIQITFNKEVLIYDKFVGGCKNANVRGSENNAAFFGGVIGSLAQRDDYTEDGKIKDRLHLNLSGIRLQPKRWLKNSSDEYVLDANNNRQLEWNTILFNNTTKVYDKVTAPTTLPAGGKATTEDKNRRLKGGNVYGGCYESGHVNGNIVIKLDGSIFESDKVFDVTTGENEILYENEDYTITKRNSGVLLAEQGMDVLGSALNVFGGGYGRDSEVWGSATVDLEAGKAYQIFGGSEEGAIGKNQSTDKDSYGNYNTYKYSYNADYSTYVNLSYETKGVAKGTSGDSPDMAECVFIYGGGFEGPIAGNTRVNLGNGRIFNSFGGSCNATIYGHTETYVGLNSNDPADFGFPWVIDKIYGANDLGGEIKNDDNTNFKSRVNTDTQSLVYNPTGDENAKVLTAGAYTEYIQGRVVNIFGGCYGDYDYRDRVFEKYTNADGTPKAGFTKPRLENAFVNFRPQSHSDNSVAKIYGAGQGHPGVFDDSKTGTAKFDTDLFRDKMQDRSYVLIDIPIGNIKFQSTKVFGAGENGGVGMYIDETVAKTNADGVTAAAVIDLAKGIIGDVFGASYNEGVTRRTIVNVPAGSKIEVHNSIFGGAYGTNNNLPCDVYESNVNYSSADARASYVYGGNNDYRRTLYARVNINSKFVQPNGFFGYAYGAGQGVGTWAQYTEVNVNDGGDLYEAYGGGYGGRVLNQKSLAVYAADNSIDLRLDAGDATRYVEDFLDNDLAKVSQLKTDLGVDGENGDEGKYNANVHIYKGGNIRNYCYGGGYGANAVVSGTTYIDLLGGTIAKDLYGGGTSGAVEDKYKTATRTPSNTFTATANVYVKGGVVRNVYGGGWEGAVGYHDESTNETTDDILGATHVYIGRIDEDLTGVDEAERYYNGIPAVQRNAYGGGEGGFVYGTANLTLNNGYIGYIYNTETGEYEEKLDDETAADGIGYRYLAEAGNLFGGGYIDNSDVDNAVVTMYGGYVRNGLYGGGEIGAVGRGDKNGNVFKAGETHIYIYRGHVYRDVFGGGRGFDNRNNVGSYGIDGYVFGKTDVNIRGGVIGTVAGVAEGYGNVFGGGNIGYVYSGNGKKSDAEGDNGYYYEIDGDGNFITVGSEKKLTEDCRVIVEPWTQVKTGTVTVGSTTYNQYDYVPTSALNTFKNKNSDTRWNNLSMDGITIHNAVFAGGNVSTGSDRVYANATTVFGNATATLNDVYHLDLITIGTEHVGGLYGDGNLTFVDGYRELNISNYGTDYYGQSDKITIDEYYQLTDREKAYFKLEYICQQTCYGKDNTQYIAGEHKTIDELKELFDSSYFYEDGTPDSTYWKEGGVCSIYAGRLLNTIQRADFVGVFGSRMVMQGAQDRVPEIVDYTNYTINRVGEVSLNKVDSRAGDTGASASHGNYFGIYNVVNFMGALTSDVDFTDERTTDNTNTELYGADGRSYYQWKLDNYNLRKRNNGSSHNKVALASGVYLELTTEKGTKENPDWGYITGVVELDLISVNKGLGGGYVYAKNEHGVRSSSGKTQTILSAYNANAVTNKKYQYTTDDASKQVIETSGNFIHGEKQIIDDCYPVAGSYKGTDAAKAHYWYIKGSIYVYDQYISAYTGSANAYAESVNIPLTITAASHGKITLLDVQPNLYAYYSSGDGATKTKLGADESMIIGTNTYHLNDTISYWDWSLLSAADQAKFVKDTYTTVAECKIGGVTYPKGYTILPDEYKTLKASVAVNDEGIRAVHDVAKNIDVDFDDIFHQSNNLGHNSGYILTFDTTNPEVWKTYYTAQSGTSKSIDESKLSGNYIKAPTYTPTTSGVYGQRPYEEGDIIQGTIHAAYEAMGTNKPTTGQAEVERAYVITEETTVGDHHLYPGVGIGESTYDASTMSGKAAPAKICTQTLELTATDYIYVGELLTEAQINKIKTDYAASFTTDEIDEHFDDAYYCKTSGLYGGKHFETGENYSGLEAWSSLSAADRKHFKFNYDAFDVLIDSTYVNPTSYYDSENGTAGNILYSKQQPIDYTAIYLGTVDLSYENERGDTLVHPDAKLTRSEYESIPNEQYHYSPILVQEAGTYYVVKVGFTRGDVSYSPGQVISSDMFTALNDDQKDYIDQINFTDAQAGSTKTYYYCRDSYVVGEHGEYREPTNISGTKINHNSAVPVGFIIADTEYNNLPNKQKNFLIQGIAPVGTSTLYVSRESNIFDLSKGKIITVVYKYEYEESDESDKHIELISEQHVINIHINFKTGVPTIGQLSEPSIVLPGTTVGLKVPNVTPGAYDILGGGWEIFAEQRDAESHVNGRPYANNQTPMYWYEDGYWVAYYTKTYLGKTYSNPVQFKVANYHDIDKVMGDKLHHLYIDHPDIIAKNKRVPKIYIDERNTTSDESKSKLDLLKDLFDFTVMSFPDADLDTEGKINVGSSDPRSKFNGQTPLSNQAQVKGGDNLEFFLRGNVEPKAYTDWTPIGNNATDECFKATLHGDGYTISGLNNSLFGYLCGNVYNLGVTGSFTSAGIVDNGDGYVENCWITTTGTPAAGVHAVFNNPTRSTGTQIVNSYYPESNTYTDFADPARGAAIQKPDRAFYNGEVAYDLNGFYLYKRYNDNTSQTTNEYTYYDANDLDDAGNMKRKTGYYKNGPLFHKYVENRYANEDFVYAGGKIPEGDNIRLYKSEDPDVPNAYYPIWPDDYIFFGQTLSYGHSTTRTHQPQPSHINKTSERLPTDDANNRVYRAPAYFRNSIQGVAHFNPSAMFAAKEKGGTHEAYPNMTAIDFSGNNDVANGYKEGWTANGADEHGFFYRPLLDNDGLTSMTNADLTRNLLAYISQPKAKATDPVTMTYNVVTTYLDDPTYAEGTYRTVAANSKDINGHYIVKDADTWTYYSPIDHLLVDKNDFNAPFAYDFNADKRMWYQRVPDRYADIDKGWDGVSLPFEAELVTTQTKGELSHFYENSIIGHEYWLREFTGIKADDRNAEGEATAYMNYPTSVGGNSKEYNNTFLYNYYYSKDSYLDHNTDEYQKDYYKESHTYSRYPYSAAAKPYIVGFPGARYYEFDLSGQFVPQNRINTNIGRLPKQTITFPSRPGISIAVSDTEIANGAVTIDGYTFNPSYLNTTVTTGSYVLNNDGSSFDKTTAETTPADATAAAFRPYFTTTTGGGAKPRRIIFGSAISSVGEQGDIDRHGDSGTDENLNIYAERSKIVVESTLSEAVQVSITTASGIRVTTFTIEPGQTITTPVTSNGVYIVNRKKLLVR